MLRGQRINIDTDHKNLTWDTLGLTSDRVYWWRLILKEYGPEIVYIKRIHNTIADAISRLEYVSPNTSENVWLNGNPRVRLNLLGWSLDHYKGGLRGQFWKAKYGTYKAARSRLENQCQQIKPLYTWNRILGVLHTHKRWYQTTAEQGTIDACMSTAQKCQKTPKIPGDGSIL